MGDRTKLTPAFREGIDACRHGHADLQLLELQDLARAVNSDAAVARHFAASERCDLALKQAMQAVPVPTDLKARLLARLAAAPVADASAATASFTNVPSTAEAAVVPVARPEAPRRKRRWMLFSLAASLLVGFSLALAWSLRPAGPVDLPTLAGAWQSQLQNDWRPMTRETRTALASIRLAVSPQGWQPISGYRGYHGTAYDLSRPGRKAVLFVVNVAPNSTLPKFPPATPQFSLEGKAVAAWLSGNQLCLLVVDGDERHYRTLIQSGQVPIA